jgi:hypothetical protein
VRHRLEGIEEVAVVPLGCVARTVDDRVVLVTNSPPGAPPGIRQLPVRGDVTALGSGTGTILVAADAKLLRFDPGGKPRGHLRAARGVTAMAQAGPGRLVLGFRDGNIELLPTAGQKRPGHTFEQVPSAAVVRLVEGPQGTLIAGFANGVVGIWDRDDGKRLEHARIHGPVVHLLLRGSKLYAASELGHHLIWDLGLFFADRCELLRQVQSRVPVVWERGHPVIAPPSRGGGCVRGRR